VNFPKEFYRHLETEDYTEIKGGIDRRTFLEIWVVAVDNRIFARSWNKSERSWFTAFFETGIGQFKYCDQIIEISGKKVEPDDELHGLINEAYLTRYTEKENRFYESGISQAEYFDYTMEFFYTEK